MSRINIQGTIDNIKSKSNVYTPIVEGIVNSIHAITGKNSKNGKIEVILFREQTLAQEFGKPNVQSIHIKDNGLGFNRENRDSFDTFYSNLKKGIGGKGFGRFMFAKYFGDVYVDSVFKDENGILNCRKFRFGKEYEIIVDEKIEKTNSKDTYSLIKLENLKPIHSFEKNIETISKKLLDKLLIFFVSDTVKCPTILLKEADGSQQIVLNDYLNTSQLISLHGERSFPLKNHQSDTDMEFKVKVFKIYYPGSQKSRISLTGHNREVTETALHKYIPEFEDDFFDENQEGQPKRNYIIKTYVLGDYLDENVSLEREGFDFAKDVPTMYHPITQVEIEQKAAELTRGCFDDDIKTRFESKKQQVQEYVTTSAPWHKSYLNELDISTIPFNPSTEVLESELQKVKFKKEQETKREFRRIFNDPHANGGLANAISKISEIGKSDLAHYVFNRKTILDALGRLLERRDDGKAELERYIHHLIFPMGSDSQKVNYEDHNLWLLDERLVFSEYIASDRKISAKKDALGEPDLIVFDQKASFRNGDNDYSNPLTIFEFKRPKRKDYSEADDPILQLGKYLKDIRAGKYEMPNGTEPIKINEYTPVYGYVIADLTERMREFADKHQLTISADNDSYFGFHRGYDMYIEVISFRKLLRDAILRNKIFFKKLLLE